MKLTNIEKTDPKVIKFLTTDQSICGACGRRYRKIGWTSLMGMRTGVTFGCRTGHKPDPRMVTVSLTGKEKYFTGVMIAT